MASSRSSVLSRRAPSLLGYEQPRVFTPPLRPLTPKTSLGFAFADFAAEVVGIELLPWQRWLATHALELLPDGTPRFRTVILLVARQNGKSTFLQLLALFFLYVRGVRLVIGTAQNLDIAEEVWQGAVDIAQDVPELSAEVEDVVMVNGKKTLVLREGERYKVQAATRRGGRGLSGDLVMLDELREHQKWDAWGAVTKTTMARALAMIWGVSNAGDRTSVVLAFLRWLAHAELSNPDGLKPPVVGLEAAPIDDDESLGIFEWSAPPGCALDDPEGWAQANPSLGHTITERAIRSALRTDPEAVFRTEVLCQWVDTLTERVIDPALWALTTADKPRKPTRPVFGLALTPGQDRAAILACGEVDGLPQLSVVEVRDGTAWVVDRLAEITADSEGPVALDKGGPAGSLLRDLETCKVKVITLTQGDYAEACGALLNDINNQAVRHVTDPDLDAAVDDAQKRALGERWAWGRKGADISPLEAATVALHGYRTQPSTEAWGFFE